MFDMETIHLDGCAEAQKRVRGKGGRAKHAFMCFPGEAVPAGFLPSGIFCPWILEGTKKKSIDDIDCG